MKPAPTVRSVTLLAALALAASAGGGEASPAHPPPAPPGPEAAAHATPEPPARAAPATPEQRAEELASLLRIGAAKLDARDGPTAGIAYREALKLARREERAPVLLGLARSHRLEGDSVKAAAVYERLLRDHASWKSAPLALLELGRTLRELGAHRLAEARFYSVIQSTLRLPEEEADHYRQLVRTAQFEIAETRLASGDAAGAARFFRRLDLLDLAPADRARARFRTAQAQLLDGDRGGAIATLTRFVAQDGDAADGPEARFVLARLLAEEGRREQALQVTLELLREARAGGEGSAWREWQRRAGQFLAQKYGEERDFVSALLLHRALAALDETPAWRAPALYQAAICLERLGKTEEARKVLEEVVETLKDEAGAAEVELQRLARWRLGQLVWSDRVHTELRRFAATPGSPSPVSATP